MKKITTQRITYYAMMLSIMCVLGMFSITFGDNIKVSLQLFVVFLIGLTAKSFIDSGIITLSYLLLGLFLPIYAGFSSGVTPTFGFVIGFVPGSMIITLIKNLFVNKENKVVKISGLVLAQVLGTLIIYFAGVLFMYLYFSTRNNTKELTTVLSWCITPYIPFDLIKLILATSIYLALEPALKKMNFIESK